MLNLYEIFDYEHRKLLEEYGIEVKNALIDDGEYTDFLKKTDIMSMEDMEDIYDYLDDYFAKQEKGANEN